MRGIVRVNSATFWQIYPTNLLFVGTARPQGRPIASTAAHRCVMAFCHPLPAPGSLFSAPRRVMQPGAQRTAFSGLPLQHHRHSMVGSSTDSQTSLCCTRRHHGFPRDAYTLRNGITLCVDACGSAAHLICIHTMRIWCILDSSHRPAVAAGGFEDM